MAEADVLAALPAGDLYDTSDAHVAEVAAKAEAWDEAMGISKSWEELKEKNERARAAGAEGPLRTQTTVGTMVARTFTITVPDGEDTQFVVILAAGSENLLPAQFDDPSQFR